MTYEINDPMKLEQETKDLGANEQKISSCTSDLKNIIVKIKENWVPDDKSQDLPVAIDVLNEVVTDLENTIIPIVSEYKKAMITLYQNTVETQSKTIQ